MSRKYCQQTGKETFTKKSFALKAARRMDRAHRGCPAVYLCPYCDGWHMTHYSYTICHDFIHTPKPIKQKDMRIFIDTVNTDETILIDTYQPPDNERRGIMLAINQQKFVAVGLSYEQALELIEALKIQAARL